MTDDFKGYQSYFKLELFALAKGLFIFIYRDPRERGARFVARKKIKIYPKSKGFGIFRIILLKNKQKLRRNMG
jgi:hypothetical protein